MRLELPAGYKHVVDLRADFNVSVSHIVVDPRPAPARGETLEGRLATTLCGLQVDTRRTLDVEGKPNGMPLWGSQSGRGMTKGHGQGFLLWPGTCGKCVGDLAKAELVHPEPVVPENAERYPTQEVAENILLGESTADMVERAWDETGRWDPLEPGWKRMGATVVFADSELRTRLVAAFWGTDTSDADALAAKALAVFHGHQREAQAQGAGQ